MGDAGMGMRKGGGACSQGNLVTGRQELTFLFDREIPLVRINHVDVSRPVKKG